MKEIEMHKINIYEFPDFDDDEENKVNKKLKEQVPFAVIGSNCVVQNGDRRVRARQYPWVENKLHCDFRTLRDMLIRTHMQDLIDVTSVVHYENFRARKLSNVMSSKLTGKSPMEQFEEAKQEVKLQMDKKKRDLQATFEAKVKQRQNKLLEMKREFARKHEGATRRYDLDKQSYDERYRDFMLEKAQFEKVYGKQDYRPELKPRNSSIRE